MQAQRGIHPMVIAMIGSVGLWMLGIPTLSAGESLMPACVNHEGALRIGAPESDCQAKEHRLPWPAELSPAERLNVGPGHWSETWDCTGAPIGFAPIPGLSVALTTQGGPGVFSLIRSMEGIPGVVASMQPVMDGVAQHADDVVWSTGTVCLGDIIAYQQVYPLPAGAHAFTMDMSRITGRAVLVGRGWLMLYDLK
jgi:hypothetical protein